MRTVLSRVGSERRLSTAKASSRVSACSTPSSKVRLDSCLRSTMPTPAGGASERPTGGRSWRSRSCSWNSTAWRAKYHRQRRRLPVRCCRPVSGARSRRTRSSATRSGERRIPRLVARGPCRRRPPWHHDRRPRAHHHQARERARTRRGERHDCNPVMCRSPNGLGVDYPAENGVAPVTGVAPNELTASEDRDWLAGTARGTSTCPPASSASRAPAMRRHALRREGVHSHQRRSLTRAIGAGPLVEARASHGRRPRRARGGRHVLCHGVPASQSRSSLAVSSLGATPVHGGKRRSPRIVDASPLGSDT